jgi:hypothetical protein
VTRARPATIGWWQKLEPECYRDLRNLHSVPPDKRSTLVRLDKPFWFDMALAPGDHSLLLFLVDGAGSNLMLVDRFQ